MIEVSKRTLALSGIYAIVNKVNGRSYIGMASCFRERWNIHRSNLNRGRHCTVALQKDWLAYGEHNFEFRILELLPLGGSPQLYRGREWFYLSQEKAPYNTALRFRDWPDLTPDPSAS